jgi:methionyl-tRNA formyltransferase
MNNANRSLQAISDGGPRNVITSTLPKKILHLSKVTTIPQNALAVLLTIANHIKREYNKIDMVAHSKKILDSSNALTYTMPHGWGCSTARQPTLIAGSESDRNHLDSSKKRLGKILDVEGGSSTSVGR